MFGKKKEKVLMDVTFFGEVENVMNMIEELNMVDYQDAEDRFTLKDNLLKLDGNVAPDFDMDEYEIGIADVAFLITCREDVTELLEVIKSNFNLDYVYTLEDHNTGMFISTDKEKQFYDLKYKVDCFDNNKLEWVTLDNYLAKDITEVAKIVGEFLQIENFEKELLIFDKNNFVDEELSYNKITGKLKDNSRFDFDILKFETA